MTLAGLELETLLLQPAVSSGYRRIIVTGICVVLRTGMHTAVLKNHLPKAQSFQKAREVLHTLDTRPGPKKTQMPGKEESVKGRNWQWLHTHSVNPCHCSAR